MSKVYRIACGAHQKNWPTPVRIYDSRAMHKLTRNHVDERLSRAFIKTLTEAMAIGLAALAVLSAAATSRAGTPEAMSLLKANCFTCHNDDKKKGGLALTTREGLLRGGDNGPAVLPGKSAASRLVQMLQPGTDPHMPPKGQLTPRAIQSLETWINAGAPWDAALLADRPPPAHEQLASLPTNYAPVLALALTPDGQRLAVGSGERVTILDLAKTNQIIATLTGHRDAVQSLAWSTNGRWLAAGSYRRLSLWDAQSDSTNHTRHWATPDGRVTALLFTPDAGTLLSGEAASSRGGVVRAWRVQDNTLAAEWSAHTDSIYGLAISADGKRLATAGGDRVAKIWQWPSRQLEAVLEGHSAAVYSVGLNGNGTQAATASADKTVLLWDLKTRLKLTQITSHKGGVTGLAWAAADKMLATSSEDGTARTFTNFIEHTGAQSSSTATERRLGGAGLLNAVAMSADGKVVAAGAQDGTVWLWNDGQLKSKWKTP